jgi:tetratricopeptide (TPR) repeat protein
VIVAAVLAALTAAHLSVSTTNPRAQDAFDRGLFLYYAYDREASERAFGAAAVLDPHLAIAYWGEALAAGPDLNTPMTRERWERGGAAILRAVALEGGASSLERSLIDAMAGRYRGSWDDWSKDDAAYRQSMTKIAQSSGDPNVQLLTAEALLERGESPQVLALVNGALRRDPLDPMANHLCIHAYEDEIDRAPGLPCSQRLDAAPFSPEAEHLAHMPAHYWIETGDYPKALASSERAYALIEQLERSGQDAAHVQQYAGHDVVVGYGAAMMLGNYATASTWAARMDQRFGVRFGPLTALRFGRYAEQLGFSADVGSYPVRGLALLHLGRIVEARSIANQIREMARSTGSSYLPELFLARLSEIDGKIDDAIAWLDRARENQHALYSAEIIPPIPAEEALGGMFLRAKRYADAVDAFNACLGAYPNDPRALFGLSEALKGLGRDAEASHARAQFENAWHGADTTLTIDDF